MIGGIDPSQPGVEIESEEAEEGCIGEQIHGDRPLSELCQPREAQQHQQWDREGEGHLLERTAMTKVDELLRNEDAQGAIT